jgi:hypothetical protein
MKKVVIKDSELISLIKNIIKEERKSDLKTYYVIKATSGKKSFYWGLYKDGSKLFIPTINWGDYDSKPKFYESIEEAKKTLKRLEKYVPTYSYTIKPFGK